MKTMRRGELKFAISKMMDIVATGKAHGYTDILKDKNPLHHSDLDKLAIYGDKEDLKIRRISDQARGYVAAGSWISAFIDVELLGD